MVAEIIQREKTKVKNSNLVYNVIQIGEIGSLTLYSDKGLVIQSEEINTIC